MGIRAAQYSGTNESAKRGVKNHCSATIVFAFLLLLSAAKAQTIEPLIEHNIEIQIERLKSNDAETRRDAVARLRALENAVASQAAARALSDSSEIVRATAAGAIVFLPTDEAVNLLLPLINDKSEFARREIVAALGEIGSKSATPELIRVLQTDKELSVRASAAVALGKIADARAVETLSQILISPRPKKKKFKDADEFLRRSAASALGEIRDKRGVPALTVALRDLKNAPDVRRESAFALGQIADQSATVVLRENLNAEDYLLARIAAAALARIKSVADERR